MSRRKPRFHSYGFTLLLSRLLPHGGHCWFCVLFFAALCGMIFLIHGSSLFPNFFTQLVGDLLSWIVFAGWWEMGVRIMCIAVLAGGDSAVCAVGGRLGRRNRGGGGAGG